MKMSPVRLVACLLPLLLVCGVAFAQDKKPEEKPAEGAKTLIPDKNLEKAVRGEVFEKRNNDQPLTEDDLRKVFVLHANKRGIKDLAGLDKCTNLLEIRLADNEIGDVKPLTALVNLQSLDLHGNKIKDIKPLAELKKLQYLQLEHNEIEDATAVAGLEKMQALYLSGNKISDIGPVAKLKGLASLYLADNQISNLAPLEGVNRVMTMDLSGNPIENLAPLKKQTQLRILMLENCKITDVGPLVELCAADAKGDRSLAPFLRLYLEGNPLSDAAKEKQVAELKEFGVRVNLNRTGKKSS